MYLLFSCLCSVKIAAGAVVCVESEIKGDVTIGKLLYSNKLIRFCLSKNKESSHLIGSDADRDKAVSKDRRRNDVMKLFSSCEFIFSHCLVIFLCFDFLSQCQPMLSRNWVDVG